MKISGALAWSDAGLRSDGRGAVGAVVWGMGCVVWGVGVWAEETRLAQRASAVRRDFMSTDYTEAVKE